MTNSGKTLNAAIMWPGISISGIMVICRSLAYCMISRIFFGYKIPHAEDYPVLLAFVPLAYWDAKPPSGSVPGTFYFNPPTGIFSKMQMQHIQFIMCHYIYIFFSKTRESGSNVPHLSIPPIFETRPIFNLYLRN